MTAEMTRRPVVLMACGSFNPPTPMHFRMFEIAKDHFNIVNNVCVLGGIVSPVNDGYAKKDLIPGNHRYAMVQAALKTSNWIKASDWEISREGWTKTRYSLQYHQNYINAYMQATINGNMDDTPPSWMPEEIINLSRNNTGVDETDGVVLNNRINNGNDGEGYMREKVQVRLLCGGDLLESFAVPGLWSNEDLEAILGEHGLVVITRSGSNPEKFIYESDILTQYKRNITLITNWVPNEVSSTMIRRLVRRGESVKYLIDDNVIAYIKGHRLYGYDSQSIKYLPIITSQSCLTTPSPNDIVMKSPTEYRNKTKDNNTSKQRNVTISSKIINYLIGVDEIDKNDVYTSSSQLGSNHVREKRSRLTNKVSSSGDLPPKSFCGDDQNSIDSLESMHALPRKTVKVITDVSGVHKIINSKKKVRGNSLDITDDVFVFINSKMVDDSDVFKSELDKLKINGEDGTCGSETAGSPRSPLRSYDEIVKFIFSEHGIQVISDRETIV